MLSVCGGRIVGVDGLLGAAGIWVKDSVLYVGCSVESLLSGRKVLGRWAPRVVNISISANSIQSLVALLNKASIKVGIYVLSSRVGIPRRQVERMSVPSIDVASSENEFVNIDAGAWALEIEKRIRSMKR